MTRRSDGAKPHTPIRRGMIRWTGGLLAGAIGLGAALPDAARAADWPTRPVKVVIPFAAGGATDLLGRALGAELAKTWGQSVVVENRPGAGGAVGAEAVAKAAADGHTLLLASGSMFTVNPFLYKTLPYSAANFEMITRVASGPMLVTVNAEGPAKTLPEFVAQAKASPGKLLFGSAGNGSQVHMAGESFAEAAGIQITHVPYKGEGPAYTDLMGGAIHVVVGNILAITPLLKGGKLRALAVTGKERSPLLPEVPTATEAGLPGYEFVGWFALMAPAGTPRDITAKVYADVQRAVEQPGLKRFIHEQGMAPSLTAPGTLGDEIARESVRWKELIANRKIGAN